MKKIKSYLLFIFASVFLLIGKTNAVLLTESEIPDGSYIIGSHMFTYSEDYPYTDLYDGNVNTAVVMLGSASFETENIKSQDEFVIYNKLFEGFWLDTLSGDLIEADSYDFEILYVNGSCIDPSCSGKTYDITFRYNNDVTSNLVKTYNYLDVIEEPASPTKLGHKFLCWTLENSDDCYDFSTPVESDLVLEASWSAYEYEITYVDTVSNKTKVVECNFTAGNECTYPNFTDYFVLKEGYTFSGWSLATSDEKVYTSTSNFKSLFGDTTKFSLYSIFNSSDYIISYNLNGGSFTSLQSPTTVYNPSELTYDISTPTRVGYQFDGWAVTKGDATVSNGLITINTVGNIEITANWTPNTYNVIYNGTNLNTTTCKYDTTCTLDLSKIAVADGKQIKSITATVDGTAYSIGSTVKNLTASNKANVPVTVTFEDIYYNISYELDGGTVASNPVKALINTSTTLTAPTRTGYTFNGWTVSSGNATISGNTLNITAENDVKLTANWNANSYNVYYNNGTTDVLLSTSSCNYDSFCDLDLTKITASAGYEFDYIEGTINGSTVTLGNRVINLTSSANGRYYVTPKFNKVQYSVTYNLNGGTLTNPNSSVTTYGDTLTINVPTKVGYDFDGWNVSSGSATVTNTSVTLTSAAAVTLSAQWTPKKYNISFDLVDGTGTISAISCTYESCTLPTTVPTKVGYDFDGWLYNGNVYVAGDVAKLDVSGNITFSAKWVNTIVYDINYDLKGGTFDGSPVSSFIVGDSFALTIPEKEGYTFDGWYDGNTKITTVTDYTADINVIAKWTPITYTLYLYADADGNSVLSEKYCEYDDTCILGDNSSSFANQRLLGWSTSKGGKLFYGDNLQLVNLVSELGADFYLYPVLEEVSSDYIVSYYLDGGSFVDENSVVRESNNGDTITLPSVGKFGYEVEKWVTDSGVEVTGTTYTVTDDVVLVPVWKQRTSYTINLIHGVDDTVEPIVVNCEIGVDCKLPSNTFTRNGYTFDGWLLQLTGEGGSSTYDDGDVFVMTWEIAVDQGTFKFDVYAVWTPITYNISYELQGAGYFNGTTTYTVEDEYIKIPLDNTDNFASGYTSSFVAWSDETGNIIEVCVDDANYVCAPVPETLGDLTFIAHYADETFTITYNADYVDDRNNIYENNDTLEFTYGDYITGLPTTTTYQQGPRQTTVNIVGWTIDGEEVDLSSYRVTSDVTLTAIFE